MRDTVKTILLIFGLVTFLFVVFAYAGVLDLSVTKWFTDKQTEITRSTNSYRTTQQTALVTFKADWDRIEVKKAELKKDPTNADIVRALENQQAGIVQQMKQQAALIPGRVPVDIAAFLESR